VVEGAQFDLQVVGCPFPDRLSSLSPSAPSQSVPSPSAPPPSPEECLPSYALDLDHETQGCVEGQGLGCEVHEGVIYANRVTFGGVKIPCIRDTFLWTETL